MGENINVFYLVVSNIIRTPKFSQKPLLYGVTLLSDRAGQKFMLNTIEHKVAF
jgi:hypothetical protein